MPSILHVFMEEKKKSRKALVSCVNNNDARCQNTKIQIKNIQKVVSKDRKGAVVLYLIII